jgi:uncharacterized protein (TIGR02271 family)
MNETNDAITRSEEELEVRTAARVTGRVRLRKRIVTETVQVSVEIRREELEIIHEQVGDGPSDDTPLGQDTVTIVLSAEEPVVSTRVVPVERVRVHKVLVAEDERVDAELAREQVELEELPGSAAQEASARG